MLHGLEALPQRGRLAALAANGAPRRPPPPSAPRRARCAAAAAAAAAPGTAARRQCVLYDYYDQLVPYEQALAWQHDLLERACADAAAPDALLLLQHPPTYTLGTGAAAAHLRFDPAAPPHPLYRVERGGEVTYHGPGQLVLYPLLRLSAPPHAPDLHAYMRALEAVALGALAEVSGLEGGREPGLTGVWVGGAKLAAIGVRARRWVTYHGMSLNVAPDLAPFAAIVPCGIQGRPVGSVVSALAAERARSGGGGGGEWSGGGGGGGEGGAAGEGALLAEYRFGLLDAFERVFSLELVPAAPAARAALEALPFGGKAPAGAAAVSAAARAG